MKKNSECFNNTILAAKLIFHEVYARYDEPGDTPIRTPNNLIPTTVARAQGLARARAHRSEIRERVNRTPVRPT